MNYYNEIKNELIDNDIIKKSKDYSKNKSDLVHYYNVGKLIIDAQGGEARTKYGNGLIKEYSKKLQLDLGKGYDETSLKRMRKFYLIIQKGATLSHQLSWSHYVEIITLNDINMINYYVNISSSNNLGVRQLRERIKTKEYERFDGKVKNKLFNNTKLEVADFIKNPIIIHNSRNCEKISEHYLKRIILEDLDNFLKELGNGFMYVGNEYKIRIISTTYVLSKICC